MKMLRQSPSRKQRSKGVKEKDPIKILFLLILLFWIIYQAKQLCDENSSKKVKSAKILNGDKFFRFGRKGIMNPLVEKEAEFGRHEDEEKEVEDGKENNEGSGGDEDIDSSEQEKIQEAEHELEDLIDEDDNEE